MYTVLDKIMIGVLTNDSYQNGYYESAEKVINLVRSFAISTLNDVMSPRMSYLFYNNKINEFRDRILKTLNLELIISYGCSFGIIVVADDFVPIFFGEGYEAVVGILKLMAFIIIPICFSTCIDSLYYVPSGNVLKGTRFIIIGSVINIIINVPLILEYGALGATIASFIAETVIAFLYIWGCRDYISVKVIVDKSYRKIISGMIMFVVIFEIDKYIPASSVVSLIIQIIFGVLIYLTILTLLRDDSLIEILDILKERKKSNKIN
jgi:O-antigen/teichoic acid export membrane protein